MIRGGCANGLTALQFKNRTRSRSCFLPPSSSPPPLPLLSPMRNPNPSAKRRKQSTGTTVDPPVAGRDSGKARGEVDIEDLVVFKREEIGEIRASLLEWYDQNRRDLPWRRLGSDGKEQGRGELKGDEDEDEDEERRAYGVWVSEVMLQQTRVATVIDYYNRWMKKWPSLQQLSLASLEEVNEIWAGLGYYRRARYLLEGAKKIAEGGGRFPRSVSDLRKVPGIGNYTAGAIASIAFNEAVPVVDGNVVRVLARLKAISANPKDSSTVKKFWKLAEQLVDPCRPGDFNQALMELGATICTPTSPSCSSCPVSGQCYALSMSKTNSSLMVTNYPQAVAKAKQRREFTAVCVVEILESLDISEGSRSNSLYLIVKRPEEGLLAGLWEFPSVLLEHDYSDAVARRKTIDSFLSKSFNIDTGKTCDVILRDDVGEYVHIFSHIRLKMYIEFLLIHLKGGMNLSSIAPDNGTIACKYVDNEELSSMGLTSGVRKVYSMVQTFKQNMNISSYNDLPRKSKRNHKEADYDRWWNILCTVYGHHSPVIEYLEST
ncbi:hypothetical protein Dimus_016915 [Dionaea muscipula]